MKKFLAILSAILLIILVSRCGNFDVADTDVISSEETSALSTVVTGIPLKESSNEISSEYPQPQTVTKPDIKEEIYIHFLDVGQADSTFIELANGEVMLIDAGNRENAYSITSYIKNLNYDTLDYVVATHPHSDHIGGMADVLNSFEIGKMYMPKQAHTTATFEKMLDVIESKNIDLYTAKSGVNILTGDNIKIDILSPDLDSYSNLNNCSAVLKLTFGDTVALFMGDAESEIEQILSGSDIDADILKVGHHGSDSSSSSGFIASVSPKKAIISCGNGNSYGHPHMSTLSTLKNNNADIFRTDEQGTIKITIDKNKNISVDKKASTIKENAPPESKSEAPVTAESSKTEKATVTDGQNQIVYRTSTGQKYHNSGCSYLKSKIQTTVNEAKSMGLAPCSRCNPPT